jgi:multimeric flavodoxin WrbA
MNIVVLNGSPKGDISVTMQYVEYIRKKFPQHRYTVHNISQKMVRIEKDREAFDEIMESIKESGGVIWAFPLYYMLCHGNYKRFIELVFEKKAEAAFKDKYAAAITTSIKFFDHTAHEYIHGISDDLGMKFFGGYSALSDDFMKKKERERFLFFAEDFFRAISQKEPLYRQYPQVVWSNPAYSPKTPSKKIAVNGKKVLILTDEKPGDYNLRKMTAHFADCFKEEIETANINDIDILGGCQGCMKCGHDNHCAYEGKDGYIEFFNSKIKTADILIFAGTVKDRYLSSRWKTFLDRSFFNTHIPVLINKQIGFIISGPLAQLPNLRKILEAYPPMQLGNCTGFVTDEPGDAAQIDSEIQSLAERSLRYAEAGYTSPYQFPTIGGRKIFRDEVWSDLKPIFQSDYKMYKKMGLLDFPQKKYFRRMMNTTFYYLLKIMPLRKKFQGFMKEGMIMQHKKILNKIS